MHKRFRPLVLVSLLSLPLFAAVSSEPLFDAVRNEDQNAVAALLNKRINVNAQEEDGATPLAWAAMRSNVQIAALLLKAGANPNLLNEQGIGPLYLAITNGSSSLAQLLLSKGADPNIVREDGETPLLTATHTCQIDVMKMLLDRGANVNARYKKFAQTALMWAAGCPAATRLLLAHGADPQAITKVWNITATIYIPSTVTLGKTGIPWNNDGAYASKVGGQNALLFAVQKHDLESVKMLLDVGIDVNSAAADGTTPLLAALYKFDPLEKEFVAGTGAPAASGSSVHFGADIPMARFLLDEGAKVNVADTPGYTPLHGAALAVADLASPNKDRSAYGGGHVRAVHLEEPKLNAATQTKVDEALVIVRRLLDAGADPNRRTLYPTSGPVGDVRLNPAPPGSSAFHIAADSDCLALIKMMADHGANPNLVRKDGHTPFSVAVLSNDLPVVKEMIARGADLTLIYNPTDHFSDPVKPISLIRGKQSIMHIAAGGGESQMIEYLHSLGVPLDLKNASGETPLDLADEQERYRAAREREGAEDHPERKIVRDSSTSDMLKKLMAKPAESVSVASK